MFFFNIDSSMISFVGGLYPLISCFNRMSTEFNIKPKKTLAGEEVERMVEGGGRKFEGGRGGQLI